MTTDELARLAWKYATLGDLRRARTAGDAPPPARVFKDLAREFPGCLRELDTLPLSTIDARRDALALAAAGAPIEPWMEWLAGYHARVRALLVAKQRARGDDARPRSRLNDTVFAALAEAHGVPAETIAGALFPRAR